MIDHLEPYRRMVRSMRFSPPVSMTQPSSQSVVQPVMPVSGVNSSLGKTISDAPTESILGSPVDPSEHVAALVHEAVCKRTVLPVTYAITENIGDRISRLSTPKPVAPVIILPKIPQPDANSTLGHGMEPQPVEVEATTLVQDSQTEATAPAPVEVEPSADEETSSNAGVEHVVESEEVERTSDNEPVAAVAELEEVEDEETSSNAGVEHVAESEEVERTFDNEPVAAVAELEEVEQVSDDQPEAAVVTEPVEVEQTLNFEDVAVVAERVEVEETSDDVSDNNISAEGVTEPIAVAEAKSDNIANTNAQVAEAEDTQAATSLENAPLEPEVTSTALNNSEADLNGSKIEGESATTEAFAAESVDASAGGTQTAPEGILSEKVSPVVEAITTPVIPSAVEQKNIEALAEPTPIGGENASDSETVNIACPECQSVDIRKNGRRHGKQRYICKDCGRQFVLSDAPTLEDKLEIGATSKKTEKVKTSQVGVGLSDRTSKSSKSRSKKKAKPKGFGGSKTD